MEFVDKDLARYLSSEPVGQRCDGIRWLQIQAQRLAQALPHDFRDLFAWEAYRDRIRRELPGLIGIPELAPMGEASLRARLTVGGDVLCERVDIPMSDGYCIPAFAFSPLERRGERLPALLYNPGWGQDKWNKSIQWLALRAARTGCVFLAIDHMPFGETAYTNHFTPTESALMNMTKVHGVGLVSGISQLALRAAEAMRAGEYLRAREDVDAGRVAIAGLCQGGMDTWLAAALDDRFCAAAPFCGASTFAIHASEMVGYFFNGDPSPFPFGVLKLCDVEHLHAAIAPRPLLVRANLPDPWWPVSGLDVIGGFAGRIYDLYGARDRLDVAAEVADHDLTGPFADALIDFIKEKV